VGKGWRILQWNRRCGEHPTMGGKDLACTQRTSWALDGLERGPQDGSCRGGRLPRSRPAPVSLDAGRPPRTHPHRRRRQVAPKPPTSRMETNPSTESTHLNQKERLWEGRRGENRTQRRRVRATQKKEREKRSPTHAPGPARRGGQATPRDTAQSPPPVRRWGRQRTRRRDRGGDGRRRCGRHRRNGVSGTQPTRRAAQGGAGRGRAHRPASAPATPRNSGWVKMGMPTFENNGKKKRQGDPIGRRKRQLTSLSGGVEGSI